MRKKRAKVHPARVRAPLAVPSLIAAKRDGGALADADIRAIIAGASRGEIPDYQLSALLMAIVWRGMTTRELTTWTEAMIDSGERLRWTSLRAPAVDKHSTGGVGDKISLPLAPLAAACGLTVPMIAGRALGHTGGTLDKLEAIPGFRTALTTREIGRVLARAGFVLAGQTARLVPADRALYALRDATATVESIPLIASSILSKKVAEGARALVMDVKVGSGAFLPELPRARELARTLIALGRRLELPVRALLTDMDQPLGDAIGNAAEVREAIDVLRGGGPADVRALTVRLGAEMLAVGGVARDRREGARRIEAAIASGAGLERFRLAVRLQGGDPRAVDDPRRLPRARHTRVLRAARKGVVTRVDAGLLGRAATLLGAGRLRKEDRIAPGTGLLLHAKVGTPVARGDALATLAYDDDARERAARPLIERAVVVGGRAPAARPLVLETLG
jgi:pyrimidine-nucleoside phosphorylase